MCNNTQWLHGYRTLSIGLESKYLQNLATKENKTLILHEMKGQVSKVKCIAEVKIATVYSEKLVNFHLRPCKHIFVVLFSLLWPEHIIAVAYCLWRLLFECPDFRGLIFLFGLSIIKVTIIKPNKNCMANTNYCKSQMISHDISLYHTERRIDYNNYDNSLALNWPRQLFHTSSKQIHLAYGMTSHNVSQGNRYGHNYVKGEKPCANIALSICNDSFCISKGSCVGGNHGLPREWRMAMGCVHNILNTEIILNEK